MVTGTMVRPPSLIPWILIGVTTAMLAVLTVVLLRQVRSERLRADGQAQEQALATARADKAELALTQAKAKVAPLEEQVQALTAERDELTGRVRALSLEVAKAGPDGAGPAPTKAPPKKASKKKPGKKKKGR